MDDFKVFNEKLLEEQDGVYYDCSYNEVYFLVNCFDEVVGVNVFENFVLEYFREDYVFGEGFFCDKEVCYLGVEEWDKVDYKILDEVEGNDEVLVIYVGYEELWNCGLVECYCDVFFKVFFVEFCVFEQESDEEIKDVGNVLQVIG